jgi:hypothetical protein
MRSDRILIGAVLFLAIGVGLICAYCNGTTGLSFGYPLAETSLHIDITTVGVPVLVGLPLIGVGLVLLLATLILAIVAQFHPAKPGRPVELSAKRREPFEE